MGRIQKVSIHVWQVLGCADHDGESGTCGNALPLCIVLFFCGGSCFVCLPSKKHFCGVQQAIKNCGIKMF